MYVHHALQDHLLLHLPLSKVQNQQLVTAEKLEEEGQRNLPYPFAY
jgi:hypothetical protein